MKCKAADSSLWEIKVSCVTPFQISRILFLENVYTFQTLQAHYFPRVGKAANFIEKSLPKIENDLSEILELSSSEVTVLKLQKPCRELDTLFT